ncbi:AAA family ATPase [Falsiroseomonas sp. HW251]|uniref:AAA family ATPase n=1 Tax=Falsiroseomonas sp. HW251 TaxID=3390998 RepID=UPI003D31F7DD
MRLLALDLLRYGHLTDACLRFRDNAGLHVVLGANEAGKSTALSAIGDALFGFPHRSDFAFLHDGKELRIGFEVASRDGSRAGFVRRKGRHNTLLDAADQPRPESALQHFLGGATRDLFQKAFGLNAATLRDGAKSLIEGGGAAGEGLLAGMGMPHLRRAMDRLDRAADELHGSRHRQRRLPKALDDFHLAQRNIEAHLVRPKEWSDTREALEKTGHELRRIAEETAALKTEELRLRRARAVRQPLATLSALRDELGDVAEIPAMPRDADERLATLTAALDRAEQDEAREEEAAARHDAELAALPRDPAILARQDAVDRLAQLAATASGAERDLPEVRQDAASQRGRITAAAANLGLDAAPEAVIARLPQERQRRDAQRLIRGHTALLTRLQGAEEALRQAERRHARAAQALSEAMRPAAAAPLRRAVETARGEGPLDRDLAAAERDLEAATRRVAAALSALPLWSGDAAGLAACALPLAASCEEAALRLDAAEAALATARHDGASILAEIATLEASLEDLARGGTVPTPDVIAAARARRDESWQVIRRQLAGDTAPDPAGPPAFEALRDEADRLADARAEDAQRVADYAARSARLLALRAQHQEAVGRDTAAAAALAEAEAGWHGLWAPSGLAAGSPAVMREWRAARDKVLDLDTRATELRGRRDAIAAKRQDAMALLAPHLPPPHLPTLAGMLAAAETACAALDAEEEAHRKLRDAAATAAGALDDARGAVADAQAALAAGAEAWRPAVAILGLPATAGPEAVEAALQDWSAIAEAASAWRAASGRIAQMEAAVQALAQETMALAQALGEVARDEAPAVTAARLARRLQDARAAEIKADGFAAQAEQRREAATTAREARQAAEAALARLHEAAGTADLPALREAVRRAARRAALLQQIDAEEARLRDHADGLAEAALRQEVEGFDPDHAAARLDAIEARQQELNGERESLGGERQRLQSALKDLEGGRDAASFAQDARQALADAQAAAERYARLHAARTLLRAGIERLRQSQQGPMLQAATRHFALLTDGRYVRLATEEDDDGAAVLRAIRGDGTACPMDQLSEGARDQLYLALRVAALEIQAEAAEPLPFIADDLLASFDEARAAAALRLLAQLGQRVQVILFTHHAHVAELAAGLPGTAVLRLPATALPAA